MTKMVLKVIGVIVFVLIIGVILIAKSKGVSPLSWKMHKAVCQKEKVAIGGYDPVAFFENGIAKKGDKANVFFWKEANWHFASPVNLDKFKSNPSTYAPQYGGYCSFAISKGFTATSDPGAWHIHEKKLYLFADEKMKNNWVNALPAIKEACEKKWQF